MTTRGPIPKTTSAIPGLGLALALASTLAVAPAPLQGQEGFTPLWTEGRLLLDARLRYEQVEQASFSLDAQALTGRVRLGVESGRVAGFRFLVEGDLNRALAVDDFNSTVDGPSDRPVIADPDSERLNRLHLAWEGLDGLAVTVGRQRIIHEHARFVGNVGFRQNEQTFDALRVAADPLPALPALTLDYAYVWQVNRVFGSESPVGTASAATHLLRLAYPTPVGTVSAHGYFMDLGDALEGASNRTLGLRFAGGAELGGPWRATYSATLSRQRDFGPNPDVFALGQRQAAVGFLRGDLSGSVGLEVLEGDGSRGFATPLATLHAFQGFADLFLTTPADGLRDRQARIAYRLSEAGPLGTVEVALGHHGFRTHRAPEGEDGTRSLGREWNVTVTSTPRTGTELSLKVADHRGSTLVPDTRKLWLTAGFRLP